MDFFDFSITITEGSNHYFFYLSVPGSAEKAIAKSPKMQAISSCDKRMLSIDVSNRGLT